jgi:1,4-dihydroxy-2-naphthoate octaprenyltransferase
MEKKESLTVLLLRVAQPFTMIGAFLTYALGLGIADYLGKVIHWPVAWSGLFLVFMLLIAKHFLSAYFFSPEEIRGASLSAEIRGEEPAFIPLQSIPRYLLLEIGLVALVLGAGVTTLLIVEKEVNLPEILALGAALLLVYVDVIPPLRLEKRGYGELITALLISNLIPSIAYLFQADSFHALVGMMTFPLTFCYLAMSAALSLEYFSFDTRHATGSMITRMGWQQVMTLHNLSILVAYVLIGAFTLIRVPWIVSWPILLSLPFGLLQVAQMLRIAEGAKPNWWMLRLNAVSTFAVMAYLTTMTLWIH